MGRTTRWRRALARRLDPEGTAPPPAPPPAPEPAEQRWSASEEHARALSALSEQFAVRILTATYQMGSQVESVESDEQDPDRLEQLYSLDHAVHRVRRQAENLLVLSGRRVEDAGRQNTTILDVVRAATSAIEHYPRIQVGRITELSVVEFAADDVIRVLTELLDNATRFSPPDSNVVVAAHLTESGSVLVRVEDTGFGMEPQHVAAVNTMLSSTVPVVVASTQSTRLGLVVVQRLALVHRMRVQLTVRPGGGTTALVLVPPELTCEMAGTSYSTFPPDLSTGGLSTTVPISTLQMSPLHRSSRAAGTSPGPVQPPPMSTVTENANGLPMRRPASLRAEQPTLPHPTPPVPPARSAGPPVPPVPAARPTAPVVPVVPPSSPATGHVPPVDHIPPADQFPSAGSPPPVLRPAREANGHGPNGVSHRSLPQRPSHARSDDDMTRTQPNLSLPELRPAGRPEPDQAGHEPPGHWSDDVGDFAAGIEDARRSPTEGSSS